MFGDQRSTPQIPVPPAPPRKINHAGFVSDSAYEKGNQDRVVAEFRRSFVLFEEAMQGFQRACHGVSVDHGFWDSARNGGELIALMHSELSEMLESLRKPHDDEHCPEFASEEIEMADLFIRAGDYCEARRLRISYAIAAKMLFNLSRPAMHGKKF
jgi:hypothetical protein